MISVETVAVILFAHFIADFFMQTEYMAHGKSKSLIPLTYHIAVYTASLLFLVVIVVGITGLVTLPAPWIFTWALWNGLAHFVVDYFSSRIMRKFYEQKRERALVLTLGLDQLLHTSLLILSWVMFI